MQADVPLGAFLSGGGFITDSSPDARTKPRPVKVFPSVLIMQNLTKPLLQRL